jgi:outer membrane murein-binding lipoprotein Lpp
MSAFASKSMVAVLTLTGALGLGGCATKSFVREQIAPVSQRVSTLETKLQETDGTAKSALAEAQAASGQAANNGQRLDQLNGRVDGMDQRLTAQEQKSAKRPRH